ncbi:HTH domain-containing protein [Natrinema versiforme]|uniref:HTH domain-containing protein n=1 Tax=Natrinema versiforme TaxID=88724 RepID=UPI001E59EC3F|nr:HTH domain-containing protein [Natrinema versiforme]
MTDSATDPDREIRVEVFLRHCADADIVEHLKETAARSRRLEERVGPADVRVETWSPVCPALEELDDAGPSVSLTVDAFRSWADREGYALCAFDRRETPSMLDRRRAVHIRVPTACVAVYEDDDLQCVAPCSDGDRTYTVEDCLTALEAGRTEPFADRDERTEPRADGHVENHAHLEEEE